MVLIQAAIVTGFVLVHLFAGKLRFLDGIPRSRWLSMAGGISVAYVFMHVFPELAEAQHSLGEDWQLASWVEHHAYLVALGGLSVFYGLERMVRASQDERRTDDDGADTTTGHGIFWLHIATFAVYNALVGYLLVDREEKDLRSLVFFAVSLGVHFLVNDYGLRQDHKQTYEKKGRWVLAAAIIVGWIVGLATEVGAEVTHALFAFMAGGIVLNVLKEELPEDRKSRFVPFLLGAAAYTALLLL